MKTRLLLICFLLWGTIVFGQVNNLRVNWGVVQNGYQGKVGFVSEFTFENRGKAELTDKKWSFCFNFCRQWMADSISPQVKLIHVNGDFYRMEPTAAFPTLKPKQKVTIRLVCNDWAFMRSDAPQGGYFQKDGAFYPVDITVLPFATAAQTMRFSGDHLPVETAESRYLKYAALTVLPDEWLSPVIPTPTLLNQGKGTLKLLPQYIVVADGAGEQEAKFLTAFLTKMGKKVVLKNEKLVASGTAPTKPESGPGIITLKIDTSGKNPRPEFYFLYVNPVSGISITAEGSAGLFYGIQSLQSLMIKFPTALPEITIMDNPRFAYRGLMLDVARNFQTKETVMKLLDRMAFYKLNRFHFHLTDDEGWRLAIPGLPELTEMGGFRGTTPQGKERLWPSFGSGPVAEIGKGNGSGYYTRADMIEILKYAAERHIEVIPELDFPGHARAPIQSMEYRYEQLSKAGRQREAEEYRLIDPQDRSVYTSVQGWNDNVVCPCRESVYHFLAKVTDELSAMYREAGLTLNMIHTGGDEIPRQAWTQSPLCQQFLSTHKEYPATHALQRYFVKRFNELLLNKNIGMAGWEELALNHTEQNGQQQVAVDNDLTGKRVTPYVWNAVWGWGNEQTAYQLANAGYPVVLCNAPNLYLDLAYCKDSLETGYSWAGFVDTRTVFSFTPTDLPHCAYSDRMGNPLDQEAIEKSFTKLTPFGRQHILGIQGCLWSENVKGSQMVDYMLFPRLIALAERAWAKKPAWESEQNPATRKEAFETDWNQFANTLGQLELKVLDRMGIKYRKPSRGRMVEHGQVKTNSEFPGAQ